MPCPLAFIAASRTLASLFPLIGRLAVVSKRRGIVRRVLLTVGIKIAQPYMRTDRAETYGLVERANRRIDLHRDTARQPEIGKRFQEKSKKVALRQEQ